MRSDHTASRSQSIASRSRDSHCRERVRSEPRPDSLSVNSLKIALLSVPQHCVALTHFNFIEALKLCLTRGESSCHATTFRQVLSGLSSAPGGTCIHIGYPATRIPC